MAAAGGRFRHVAVNLREAEAATAFIHEAGEADGIDLLVNNAGGQFFAPATEISARGWAAVIDLNLTAVFTVTRAAHPFLARAAAAGRGRPSSTSRCRASTAARWAWRIRSRPAPGSWR